jgi:putative ABC transport system substrate-binding protein
MSGVDRMTRRKVLAVLGGTIATLPLAARAQQPAMPVIGFISARTAKDSEFVVAAFRRGLSESGFMEGQNLAIEFRWAENRYDRLPVLVAELTRRQVAVIAAISGTPTALAAKAATATIPIVFAIGGDPVAPGLVTRLNRPGANITGASFFTSALGTKRLELLRQLLPTVAMIGVLVNPNNPPSVLEWANVEEAARAIGQQVRVINASTEGDIETAFATMAKYRARALLVTGDPFFFRHRVKLVTLAARHKLPAIYFLPEFTRVGGLMSYGANQSDTYRQAGIYVGRVLKGEKPGDLPVMLPTKFELTVNLKTAKALGLTIPPTLLIQADQMVE